MSITSYFLKTERDQAFAPISPPLLSGAPPIVLTLCVLQSFGFRSGRDANKFSDVEVLHSPNGLAVLPKYINSYMSLEVENYVDLGTHGMFICKVVDSKVISNVETMTYNYYQANVKPRPEQKKKGWVCKVCGYVYEGEELPEGFICPLCKHGVDDFERLE